MWPMSYHICSEIPHWKHWSLMAEQPLAVPWKTPTWRVCCLLQSCQRHLFIGALQLVSKWVWSEYKKQVSFVNLRQLTYNGPLRASWGSFIGPTTKSNWTSVDWHYDRTFMLFLFPSPTQLLYMLRVTASEGGTGEECKDLARDRPRTPFVHFLESWIYMQ